MLHSDIKQCRASSKDIEIKRGRVIQSKTNTDRRLCHYPLKLNTRNILTNSQINSDERQVLFANIVSKLPILYNLVLMQVYTSHVLQRKTGFNMICNMFPHIIWYLCKAKSDILLVHTDYEHLCINFEAGIQLMKQFVDNWHLPCWQC